MVNNNNSCRVAPLLQLLNLLRVRLISLARAVSNRTRTQMSSCWPKSRTICKKRALLSFLLLSLNKLRGHWNVYRSALLLNFYCWTHPFPPSKTIHMATTSSSCLLPLSLFFRHHPPQCRIFRFSLDMVSCVRSSYCMCSLINSSTK